MKLKLITDNKNNSGQTLVETLFVILFVIGLFCSLVQLFLLCVTRIVMFDAAQAGVRAAIVGKSPYTSVAYVLSSQYIGEQIIPIPESRYTNSNRTIICCEIKYLQKVIFPSFFSVFGINYLPGTASCRMIAPPEPDYFKKSWPGANND
jgi:hypothetical protein